jgi:hypothetical protein
VHLAEGLLAVEGDTRRVDRAFFFGIAVVERESVEGLL